MKKTIYFLALTFVVCATIACGKDDEMTTGMQNPNPVDIANIDCSTVTYSGVIAPLIELKCAVSSGCHGATSVNGEMTDYEKTKVFADNGEMERRALELQDMPQGGTMTSEQLGQIQCWLDAGAPDN